MALTRIQSGSFAPGAIRTEDLSSNTTAAFATSASVAEFATSLAPKVSSVNVANSAFAVLDDTAVNVGGGYIVVTGTNFAEGVTVLVDTTAASAVTRVNSTTLRVQVPAKAAASYNLFVVNPDGGTGIRVSGITYSGLPAWVTSTPLTNKTRNTLINFNLSATDATSYALAAGSTLPAGTALLANGYFYGTPTGADIDTTYSFDIVATDAENQESSKTFGITITAAMPATAYVWGPTTYGQSGLGSLTLNISSPTQLGSLTNWNTFTFSNDLLSTAAIKTDNTLWAWGRNFLGQFGNNERTPVDGIVSPVQVGADTNWKQVVMPYSVFFFLKTTGTLWYSGDAGVLKNTSDAVTWRSSPVQLGASSDWSFLAATSGEYRREIYAIKTNGTLWAWGSNDNGQLGTNNIITYSSPVQIGTDTNWKMISTTQKNGTVNLATKTNGTLWAWGRNDYLVVNGGTSGYISSPVQVGALTNWSTVHAGTGYTYFAIKTDGTLWTWGHGDYGKLGINSVRTRASSPVQVGTDTNWKKVESFGFTTAGVKTNGTLWTWGANRNQFSAAQYGFLGSNQSIDVFRSSPVQLGANTNWSSVFAPIGSDVQPGGFFATREV
jgi:alpha-tubulin suppressor-like RCC1 family protein